MKRILTITTMAFSLMLLTSLKNKASAQPGFEADISFQTFYDDLDPYGRWMDYPDYGYVWIPETGPDFRPYSTNGHWVWSDEYDWMWVSDYDWGWAPFHYGRWMYDPFYGWMWVPGYEWSPAWVAWRDGGDYYGWAPLRPGINISVGFSIGSYNPPIDYWCFAPRRYITSYRIYDYCVPRQNNITIINNTTIINNYNYNRNVFRTGPGRRDAERYAGRINSVRFRASSTPGRTGFRNNEVSMYRPNVRRDDSRTYAPRRTQSFDRNRNNGNANVTPGNGNNLPQRRDINNNRDFNNRNGNSRNNDQGRNVITRDNNNPAQPGNRDTRNRRLDNSSRNRNNDNANVTPGNGNNLPQRRDINNNRNGDNRNNNRQIDRNNNNGRIERPNVPDRNNNRSFDRNNNNRAQRPSSPQVQQRRQEQPRQMERRSNSNDNNNRGNQGNNNSRRRR